MRKLGPPDITLQLATVHHQDGCCMPVKMRFHVNISKAGNSIDRLEEAKLVWLEKLSKRKA